jgi:hypothetical protein
LNFTNTTTEYVNLTGRQAMFNGGENFSISGWINPYSLNNHPEVIVDDNDPISKATSQDNGYEVYVNSTGALTFSVGVAGIVGFFSVATPANSIPTGTWTHFSVTYNQTNDNASIYLNGVWNASANSSGLSFVPDSSCYPIIGSQAGGAVLGPNDGGCDLWLGNFSFAGQMDTLQFWNRTLNAPDISNLYAWENGTGISNGNGNFIHNFTNVSVAVRARNYTFNDSGLTAWWDLGNSADNESVIQKSFDLSGLNNTLLANTANIYPALVTGACASDTDCENFTANFPGLGLQDTLPLSVNNQTSTFNFWVEPNGPSVGGEFLLEGNWCYATGYSGVAMELFGNPGIQISWTNGTGGTAQNTVFPGSLIALGKWAMITVEFNNGTNTVWVDAQQIGSPLVTNVSLNTSAVGVNSNGLFQVATGDGGACGQQGQFNGTMGDVMIFNRTWSLAEIQSMYNGGNPTNSTGLTSNWTGWQQPSLSQNGNETFSPFFGNIEQWRANLTSISTNYSAFLYNVTLTYSVPPLPPSLLNYSNETTCTNVTASLLWTDNLYNLAYWTISINNGTGQFINYSGPTAFTPSLTSQANYTWCAKVDHGATVQWEMYGNDTGGDSALTQPYTILNGNQVQDIPPLAAPFNYGWLVLVLLFAGYSLVKTYSNENKINKLRKGIASDEE